MRDFALIEQAAEYNTALDLTNAPDDILVSGSQNVVIDRNRKIASRNGYSRLGVANTALTPVRGGATWNNSTGGEIPLRFYSQTLEAYLGTVDATVLNAWDAVNASLSATARPRVATWFDSTENIDLLLWVQSDTNIYEWNGAVAVVASITGTTVTKAGTNTFAQNRFYTTRNKTFKCLRTGTEYTYTGGESTTTLTGIADTTDLQAGDVLIQKMVTRSNKPSATRINDTIFQNENQIFLGSFTDNLVYASKNTDFTLFTYSSPRVAGEGALFTLDGISNGFGTLGQSLVLFAGKNSIFQADYTQITVSTTLAETLSVKKLDSGVNQGSYSADTVVQVGNSIVYLTNEPAIRSISNPNDVVGLDPKALSNPIKPDFDAESFANAHAIWYKNGYYLAAPASSKLYILQYVEDADGKLRRYWQPPQILPVRVLSIISGLLYGHSNGVPETYKLFDSAVYSDTASDDSKLPINAIAKGPYRTFKKRSFLKNFDEYYVDGAISPSTRDLLLTLNYEYGGYAQIVEKEIDGGDETILEESVLGAGLGQTPLGQEPLGGLTTTPSTARVFKITFEIPREDFHKIQATFSTNAVDKYWSVGSHGPNVVLSPRKDTAIKQ